MDEVCHGGVGRSVKATQTGSTPQRLPSKQTHIIRRSTRKRSNYCTFQSVLDTQTTPAKKARRTPVTSPLPVPTLTTLPYVVIQTLMMYFNVDTLEILSKTCSFFDQIISGKFLTTIEFPFPVDFNNELASSNVEKKPLLRIKCKKSKDQVSILPDVSSSACSMHKIMMKTLPDAMDYIVKSQLSVLSLNLLRELDFVPEGLDRRGVVTRILPEKTKFTYDKFDARMLIQLNRMGSLRHVTRLYMLVDHNFFLHPALSAMFPSLIELGLCLVEITGMSNNIYIHKYLRRLKNIVAAAKAPILKLTVVKETRRKVTKLLKNRFVEKLIVEGPCTMNLVPIMENLKVLEVKLDSSLLNSNCTYWRSKEDDRQLHRDGVCCVNIGTLFEKCPNLENFMGVDVGSITKESFKKWNSGLKKKFYQSYLNQGGNKEFKLWAKSRWFSKTSHHPSCLTHRDAS